MGLNKPITVGGGLTAAEVQTIIDAQTTAIAGKVDAQTNTLKTDIPSSISGGASISDINAALDEKLPQYQNGAVVKSKQLCIVNSISAETIYNSYTALYGSNMGFTSNSNNGTVYHVYASDEKTLLERLKDICGAIILAPINPSKCLVESITKGIYEDRLTPERLIERKISYSPGNYTSNGRIFTLASTEADKFMILEFN